MNKIVNTLIAQVLHNNNVSVPRILDSYSNEDNCSFDGCHCECDYNCDWDFDENN